MATRRANSGLFWLFFSIVLSVKVSGDEFLIVESVGFGKWVACHHPQNREIRRKKKLKYPAAACAFSLGVSVLLFWPLLLF